mmetsp:Transcript_7476/g.15332  ORF Transcript_7476/g.15332 Transcript_7476/m.15332 type:complete len:500 (-) Transcript_7476:83-1582(-)
MSKPEFQYVTELRDHDVVLGRGSGPNDRQGNINFRSLCKDKKIAYIEATSRDEKGRIAADIVATVHGRGGRFLKRLTAEQAKNVDVQLRGADAVYELADQQTILEKTKQTLRQNRADFVAKVEKEVGRAPVVGAYPIHQRKSEDDKQKKDEVIPLVKSNGGKTADDNNIVNNIDPIPLGESCGLDSMNRPTMGTNSATMLLAALMGDNNLQSNNTPQAQGCALAESTQSIISAMSIQDMSLLLYDALDGQSNGTEMDSANMFQSILNECSVNEDMADQLVQELVKDSKSEQGTFSFTGQQKALLLHYEQNHQRVQQQQQQAQHPFGQYRLDDAPDSVFSSLVRHYNDDGEPNQLHGVHEEFFANYSDPTIHRSASEELIEPANYMDESMDISYQAAKDLHKALGGSSLTKASNSRKYSSSSSRKSMLRRRGNSFDSSLRSLMSMSISELTPLPGPSFPPPTRERSSGTPDEVKVKNQIDGWNSLRVSELYTEEDFQLGL